MDERDAGDRLFDRLEAEDVMALSSEERETIADALLAGSLKDAPLSPRALAIAREADAILVELEKKSPGSRATWAGAARDILTEPSKSYTDMTGDELQREIERRDKYHPG